MVDKSKSGKENNVKDLDPGKGSQNVAEAGSMMTPGNIDNVREILFGAQAQQYEQRFNRIEDVLKKELANIRDETKKAISVLENFAKKEFQSLSDEIHVEKRDRSENFDEISETLKSTNKNLEKKIVMLEEKNIKLQRDIQEQMLKQSNELMEEIRVKHEEVSSTLDGAVKNLTDKKTDRVALANLFTEVSMRLKEEFSLPEF